VKRRKSTAIGATVSRKEFAVKARKGRGRKQHLWVRNLQEVLVAEFERLSTAGLKFNSTILRVLAKDILRNKDGEYDFHIGGSDVEHLEPSITRRWILPFMDRFNIVGRRQCGKLMVAQPKQIEMEQPVAYHLGVLSREITSGALDEDLLENVDETHFVINMDDGRTLSFIGANDVRYADVSSGNDAITMVVRLTGGRKASIQPPFLIFLNKSRNYPIRGVPDDVPGVSYRTSPKAWMDRTVFVQWLSEPRAIRKDEFGRKKVIFVDNCSGHGETEAQLGQLKAINGDLRVLSPNSTHLCQSCGSFVIQKIKERWRFLWDQKKCELLKSKEWTDGLLKSGKLPNPGK